MSCSNCYNGCTEISTDRCIRYTGIDVPVLGIKNGDSLSFVEQALIEFLTATLDGSGIVITLPPNTLCQIVSDNLPTCGELTASVLFEALVKSACDLQVQINTVAADVLIIDNQLTALESNYDLRNTCLTSVTPSVTPSSGTHDVLQATINAVCQLKLDVQNNYVKIDDLDALIAAFIAGGAISTKYYVRMIPYAAVPYFGALSGFDANGVGISSGPWEKIYICNGYGGLTPDMRGRVTVGTNDGVGGGGPLNSVVAPVAPNPTISLNSNVGNFNVTLNATQMPNHTHGATATSIVTPSSHSHTYIATAGNGLADGSVSSHPVGPLNANGVTSSVTIDVATNVNISPVGGGLSHENFQPSVGCYYIMYIP